MSPADSSIYGQFGVSAYNVITTAAECSSGGNRF